MSMNKLILAAVAGTFLAGSAAMAAAPVQLTEVQMDDVTAGWRMTSTMATTGGGATYASGLLASGFFNQSSQAGSVEMDSLTMKSSGKWCKCGSTSAMSVVETGAAAATSGGFGTALGAGKTYSGGTYAATMTFSK